MDCPICLEAINSYDRKTLSCSHVFHAECYLKCVKANNYNSFIKCPLCREINVATSLPYSHAKNNLELLHKKQRCKAITKLGRRCKCNNTIFSRYCHLHEKVKVNKDDYEIIQEYVQWLFLSQSKIKTKICMVHLLKHLLKYIHENDKKKVTLTDIHYYYFRFYACELTLKNAALIETFCNYYEIEGLDTVWLDECKDVGDIFTP